MHAVLRLALSSYIVFTGPVSHAYLSRNEPGRGSFFHVHGIRGDLHICLAITYSAGMAHST